MKKKGIVVRPIIFWALGILVLFVVIFVIIGPEQLLAKARDTAFDFGLGILPGEKVPELSGGGSIPGALLDDFNDLVNHIKDDATGEHCLIYAGKMRIPEDFVIVLSEDKAEIKKKGLGGLSPALKEEDIDIKPCIIIGSAAVAFHNCYLGGNPITGVCNGLVEIMQDEIILEKDEYYNYIFNSGQDFCFIKFYDDWFNFWCSEPRNNGAEGIDNDCRNRIRENIAMCS